MKGLAVVKQRIEEAFRSVHNDQRTRDQVKASHELLRILREEDINTDSADAGCTARAAQIFNRKAEALARAALRSSQIPRQIVQRTNVHRVWVVEVPTESGETLIAEALRLAGRK